ncbi:MAG: twin-arginine translocase TatA/TatE family subunit [Acidimicrobiales bacterium]|jgi:Sec-independent protein translocase protein TatA
MFIGEIFGPDLLIVVIVLGVLLFGGAAIPKFAKNLGSAKSEFEKGLKTAKDAKSDIDVAVARVTTPDTKS